MELIEIRVHPAGAVEAIYAGANDEDRIWIVDQAGVATELTPAREVLGRDLAMDLIGALDEAGPPWRLADQRSATLQLALDAGRDGPDLWRILSRDRRPVELTFSDLIGGASTPVRGGGVYRLGAPVYGEIAEGKLTATFLDADSAPIDAPVSIPLHALNHGVSVTTPDAARALAIVLSLPSTRAGAEVLIGRPWLNDGAGAAIQLTRSALRRLRPMLAQGRLTARIRAPLPAHLCDPAQSGTFDLRIEGPEGPLTVPGLHLDFVPTLDLSVARLERASLVRLAGRLRRRAQRYLTLQLCIDGRLGPVQTVKAAATGKFDARLPIPAEHLDGRPHWIEARIADSQAVVFAAHAPIAAFHSRWAVLQAWSQPPLSPESSPAAAHHLRAVSEWARRQARGQAIPEVLALHEELLAGVRRRQSYPGFAFPQVDAPRVSVVMPAHNRFEISHIGLCGLLFAPNATAFEVILVDDGSSDETVRAEAVFPGVRVIHRAAGEGFVAACNDGAAQALGEFVCFLNNDTEVTAGWLDELVRPFDEDARTGLTGAKLLYPDGRLQEAGGIVWGTGDPWNAGRGGDAEAPMWNYRRRADYLSGAAILTPMSLWRDLDGFGQEWAPAYFEDTDYAFKVRAAGHEVVYVPTAEVYHFEGQTAGVDKTEGVKRQQELNRPKFKAKWRDLYEEHGPEVGHRPDLEKDRGAAFRAVVVAPSLRLDEATLAAAADLRGQGGKVTLLPLDLQWRPEAEAWGRRGVETLYSPYVTDPAAHLAAMAAEIDRIVWLCEPIPGWSVVVDAGGPPPPDQDAGPQAG